MAQLVDMNLASIARDRAALSGGDRTEDGRTGEHGRRPTLADAMERHLAELFRERGEMPPPGLYYRILREIEYPLISAVLAATRGNQIKAAELLGLNRNTLRKKVRDLDIRWIRLPR